MASRRSVPRQLRAGVEGPPGAGKTSLSAGLAAQLGGVVVGRMLTSAQAAAIPGDPRSVWRVNDVLKSFVARRHTSGVVVLDRTYWSVLAHAYTQLERGDAQYWRETLSWASKSLEREAIIDVHLLVTLKVDPAQASHAVCQRAGYRRVSVAEIQALNRFYLNPPQAALDLTHAVHVQVEAHHDLQDMIAVVTNALGDSALPALWEG